jgi:hypothetical protein
MKRTSITILALRGLAIVIGIFFIIKSNEAGSVSGVLVFAVATVLAGIGFYKNLKKITKDLADEKSNI